MSNDMAIIKANRKSQKDRHQAHEKIFPSSLNAFYLAKCLLFGKKLSNRDNKLSDSPICSNKPGPGFAVPVEI